MLVACGGAEGQKCDINLILRAQDCNATAEPQVSYSTSHLYTYITITLTAAGNNEFTIVTYNHAVNEGIERKNQWMIANL